MLTFVCAALGAAGYSVRDEAYFSAKFGLGYALGIVGLAMMTLLLLYSARKRLRPLRPLGPTRRWLALHMALGLLGPTAVMFHANFRLASLNATAAMLCTMLVAGSGIVGRMVYTRVYSQLRGRLATLDELRSEVAEERGPLRTVARRAPELAAALRNIEAFALGRSTGTRARVRRLLFVGHHARAVRALGRQVIARETRHPAGPHPRAARRALDGYLKAVVRVARFSFYERVFGLWHAVHLPLCALLFTAAVVHVVAVHMY